VASSTALSSKAAEPIVEATSGAARPSSPEPPLAVSNADRTELSPPSGEQSATLDEAVEAALLYQSSQLLSPQVGNAASITGTDAVPTPYDEALELTAVLNDPDVSSILGPTGTGGALHVGSRSSVSVAASAAASVSVATASRVEAHRGSEPALFPSGLYNRQHAATSLLPDWNTPWDEPLEHIAHAAVKSKGIYEDDAAYASAPKGKPGRVRYNNATAVATPPPSVRRLSSLPPHSDPYSGPNNFPRSPDDLRAPSLQSAMARKLDRLPRLRGPVRKGGTRERTGLR
jgi:hypothetical protein